jgi:hypothetical protein
VLAALRLELDAPNTIVSGEGGDESEAANVITVALDETAGVAPLAALVATAMQVPSPDARKSRPLSRHPLADPPFSLNVVGPPFGSPVVLSDNTTPTRPFVDVIVSTGGAVIVVVVVTGVGDETGGVVVGGAGGGDGLTPVPVTVTVWTPLPSFPSSSH